ncbi:SseB family protein [Rhodobacter ferrooxidans]|uniref:SseB protein N-terminal domain-containing protein n=1 Tax=Rhodobacter ferrooxidans TaxID=371731 RepID=C8S0L1_9RHOB|nr:SseB family protein [Rhodobacter sp. SW2]EEW25545.1 conserved hypothetical protein [Rhodobacter sp. SW2]
MTPLDTAHAAMQAAPDDDTARLRFYERLADGELFLLLESEAKGDSLTPQVFDLEGGPVVLVFDLEERLAAFTGIPAPYAAMPGRVIAAHLAGQGIGLGLNLGVAEAAMLLPPEAVDWLAETLDNPPEAVEARPVAFHAPDLAEALLTGLDAKLARAGGLADHALLAGVSYDDGSTGLVLAFIDTAPGAEAPLARAAGEALTFSGLDQGGIDVIFLAATDAATAPLTKVALRFDLPQPEVPETITPIAPGSDPDNPPKLRW